MIKVYVWASHGDNVGHASMHLSEGNTYISFWPQNPVSATAPESPSWNPDNLDEDISNEDGKSPQMFRINAGSDIQKKIKAWWSQFKSRNYHIASNNCSTAVFLGLKAGFSYLSCLDGRVSLWVPKAAGMVATGVAEGQSYFTGRKIQEIADAAKAEAVQIAKHHGGKKGGKYVQKKY